MGKLGVPTTVQVIDERKDMRVSDKYSKIELLTLFGVETEKSQSWVYYTGCAKDVVGLAYSKAADLLEIILLPCSDEKNGNSVMVNMDIIIPSLDEKYPGWREEELFVFNSVTRKKVESKDFTSISPQVFGKGDTILLAKRNPEVANSPADIDKLYTIYYPDLERRTDTCILALAKIFFSDYMANPQEVVVDRTIKKSPGGLLAFSLITEYFVQRRGYPKIDLNEIPALPPLGSGFKDPIFSRSFDCSELDKLSSEVKKKNTGGQLLPDKEEVTLSAIVGLGLDAVLCNLGSPDQVIELRVDILTDKIKAARIQKGGLIVNTFNKEVQFDEISSALDSDNIAVIYPDGTLAPSAVTDDDELSDCMFGYG